MLLFHWLMSSYLFYRMARTKVMPKKDERGGESWVLQSREARRALAEKRWSPLPSTSPFPSQEALTHERGGKAAHGGGREVGGGSKKAGRCGKVSIIIANLTVGPDACRGWAIYFWSGGSSDLLWEAKPPRRNSSRLERSRRPGSTGLAQLLFERPGSSNRALSSSLGNSPSCG